MKKNNEIKKTYDTYEVAELLNCSNKRAQIYCRDIRRWSKRKSCGRSHIWIVDFNNYFENKGEEFYEH